MTTAAIIAFTVTASLTGCALLVVCFDAPRRIRVAAARLRRWRRRGLLSLPPFGRRLP
ncbi:MAG: hypothetical protein M3340_12110 [Actinomycetota bacterium]|nr:hypothetical protein [Actinomycetota bacterium]